MNNELLLDVLNDLQKADQLSFDALHQLSEQYPWFAGVHTLLATQKSRKSGTIDLFAWQHAALYSNRPAVLEWQLQRTQNGNPNLTSLPTESLPLPSELIDPKDVAIAGIKSAPFHSTRHMPEEQKQEDALDAAIDAHAIVDAHDATEVWRQQELEDAAADANASIEAAATISEQREDTKAFDGTDSPPPPPTKKAHPPLAFEPYHTVDYFASQGIRLQEDKLGSDELSRQVKTFTQWLRSMKKIYNDSQTELPADVEQQIHHIADTSNQQSEVVTETMAEVLVLQGKKGKALEIYSKLILLHPEKSAYFADRIKQLK